MAMELKVIQRKPTIAEYNELRLLVGWPSLAAELVQIGLSNSIHSIVVQNDSDIVIGMGRIVGDNAIYLHIQDVIVRPAYQRQGIGKMIMHELFNYIDKVGGKNTNIGLMSSRGREDFYRQFGFIERPNDKFGAGMIKIKK